MSQVVVHINVLGETQIARKMLRYGERAGSARPVMEAAHDYLTQVSERQFDTEGAASGNPWAQLTDETIARKLRSKDARTRANADKIMWASEKLRNSLVNQGDPKMIHRVTNTMMMYGTKLKYGQPHMKPGPDGRPRRRPVDLKEMQKLVLMRAIQLWISRGIVKMGKP